MATDESAVKESALAKKVKCASFDISTYSRLEGMVAFLKKTCASLLSEVVKSPVQPAAAKTNMQEAKTALEETPEGAVYYRFSDKFDENAMLVSFSPTFVSALSETLLGSDFHPADETPAPTDLDCELTQLFAADLIAEVNKYLVGQFNDPRAGGLKYAEKTSSGEKILKSFQTAAFFCATIDLQLENAQLNSPMTFLIPAEYLERKGLLSQASATVSSKGSKTQWYSDMFSNIREMDIGLPVLIAKYKMTLSELSNLEVGQTMALDEKAAGDLDVMLDTDAGMVTLCKGRLGVFKKNKAVKITSEPGAPAA